MSKYKGLFTFDLDNHRYVPVGAADGIIDCMDYEPNSRSTEPLIKDEKIRKAIRAWAEANGVGEVLYKEDNYRFYADDTEAGSMIEFENMPEYIGLKHECRYTITELCGEKE